MSSMDADICLKCLMIKVCYLLVCCISYGKGAANSRGCPKGYCLDGNCTLVGKKLSCSCYNAGSGDHCDESLDVNACHTLQCEHGHCSVGQNSLYYCQCLVGWGGEKCDKLTGHSCRDKPCLNGGKCYTSLNANEPNYKCECSYNSAGPNCEKLFSSTTFLNSEIKFKEPSSPNAHHMTDYTGIGIMMGIIMFLSVFVLMYTRLLRSSRHDHLLNGHRLHNYFAGLRAIPVQTSENLSDHGIYREAQSLSLPIRHYPGAGSGCTCTISSEPHCSCFSNTMNGLTLEANIRLMHIYVEDSVSNWSDASLSEGTEPPPAYSDVVSDRSSVIYTTGCCETPPPAYEDL